MAGIQSKHVQRSFYHIETAYSSNFRKEWMSKVSGSISWDTSNYNITAVGRPTHTLSALQWGVAFSPYASNVTRQDSFTTGANSTF
ncbi:hypothetical protein [Marinilactibacillus psychrotolerans]|uniref:Uncharacterized protein n=3 Tax=Marinilactibacillus psychrotolerans TaxID=191770 RepID=A0A5R9BWY7_9LACT|nr:hypothetical protein [Marinilactibacillus psychrotolerans]TLQ05218.1 hypothetical protein FEZ48_12665 [Marinilactibacillus psychrotolerans]SJN43717.1 hypothetical protein FM115_10160 [Marinilactibacillus psychrotolerans 42ea]